MTRHSKFLNILHGSRTITSTWILVTSLLLPLVSDAQDKPSVPNQQKISNREDFTGLNDRRLEHLTYIYKGEMTPAQYIQSHPAIIGTWRYHSETKTHWIGDLHYPTDNTDRPTPNSFYMVSKLKVKKVSVPNLVIDMKNMPRRILLEKSNPKAFLDDRDGKVLDFTLIGFEKVVGHTTGIIPLFSVLPYMPSEAAKRTAELERFLIHFHQVEDVIRSRALTKDNPVLESFNKLCINSIKAGEDIIGKSQEQKSFIAARKLLYKKVQQDLIPILERAHRKEKYTPKDRTATNEIDALIRVAITEFLAKELALPKKD